MIRCDQIGEERQLIELRDRCNLWERHIERVRNLETKAEVVVKVKDG